MSVDQITAHDIDVQERAINRSTRLSRRVYESVRDIGDIPVPADPGLAEPAEPVALTGP